ncbi:MAG: tRNA (guanine-N(7)-)-methyltransferase [Acidobacteriota bacterium]|nr:tRNA (guanine-N(7)-)-methyltransferase [Acidobacteriota bacterium]
MRRPRVWWRGRESDLRALPAPLRLAEMLPGGGAWEIELGFGKGRYLLGRAASAPQGRFVGVEVASRYYRLARDRARKRELANLALVHGEAVYLMATTLGAGWAHAVHVYFPDPWPKDRHHKRRLFDPETVDLVLALLVPGGRLSFATDHLEYGGLVRDLLGAHPEVDLEVVDGPWPGGPRTNYEAKFVAAGRPVVRLVAGRRADGRGELLHPAGRSAVLAAPRPGS